MGNNNSKEFDILAPLDDLADMFFDKVSTTLEHDNTPTKQVNFEAKNGSKEKRNPAAELSRTFKSTAKKTGKTPGKQESGDVDGDDGDDNDDTESDDSKTKESK